MPFGDFRDFGIPSLPKLDLAAMTSCLAHKIEGAERRAFGRLGGLEVLFRPPERRSGFGSCPDPVPPPFQTPPPYRSSIPVTPIPPAVQIEINPRPLPFCSSIFASDDTIRAPVAANGCPMAILPPFTFIFERSTFPSG